ncbi:hypothetical protein BC831DRAFT_463623, partial [Entophlyctis helioformis]
MHVVIWLHTNRSEGCTADALVNAVRVRHVHMVQWLLTTMTTVVWDVSAAIHAAARVSATDCLSELLPLRTRR